MFQAKQLNLEMKPWYEMADFYNKTVALYGRQFLVLKIIIALIVILSIFNTITMSIWERTGRSARSWPWVTRNGK